MTLIVADTTCGLPRHLLRQRGIPLIPQIVIFGDKEYRDDTELDTTSFLEKLKAAPSLPKTAAPPPAFYNLIFEQAQTSRDSVLVLAPSAKVSGTVRAATLAAQDFPGLDVRVIDTLTLACNLGSLVLAADDMAKSGKSADEIQAQIENLIPRGRIGGAKALLGELLQVKPILHILDGQVEPFEQQRTKKRALARLVEVVEEQCPKSDAARLSVMHAGAEDEARALAAGLKSRALVDEVPIYELPPAIVTHGGPKTMGVGFFV
jgi:DegV family protein with EDD domain